MAQAKHIISFSGGKDSTALLLKMLENGMPVDEIIFCDTGLEFPEMYEHIKKVEKYIERAITVIKSEKSFEYYMFDCEKIKGKNKGKKGYGWSDFRNRWCTTKLKRDVLNNYNKNTNKGIGIVEYRGIAFDEAERALKNQTGRILKYPLIDWKMTEADCLKFCYEHGFDWGGLYEKMARVSCYLCPLQRLSEAKVLWKDYPELWRHMKELDLRCIEKFERKFRPDYSIEELEQKFKREEDKTDV